MYKFFNVQPKEKDTVQDYDSLNLYLKSIFDATENTYGYRRDEDDKQEWYQRYIDEVDEVWQKVKMWNNNYQWEKLEKFYCLVKANLQLRKGQGQYELFEDAKESYNEAVALLRKYVKQEEDDERDIVDLLIQLSLGKYFRNLGHGERRSYFHTAIYEMEKVERWIKAGGEKCGKQQTQIWLDVRVNIARAYKNLYELEESKKILGEIIHGIGDKAGDEASIALQKLQELNIEEVQQVETAPFYEQMEGDKDLYRLYLIQALVQLAIVYRKERKYPIATGLCQAVEAIDRGNMDAKNNLGVCHRKEGKYELAKREFKELKWRKNRFAEINYWKCVLNEMEKQDNYIFDEQEKESLKNFMERGKTDREIRLLKGRFLQQQEKVDEAYQIFRKLYEEYPYVKAGTIGLKAYYNMAKCLMMQEKYQQAKRILDVIIELCGENERLASIDRGWCMMQMNQYRAATQQYKLIMNINQKETEDELRQWKAPEDWPQFERMKVQNNLGECYLRTKNIPYAKIMFEKVCAEEKDNVAGISFIAQCYMLEGEKFRKMGNYDRAKSEYEQAINKLEMAQRLEVVEKRKKIGKEEEKDIQVISKCIAAKGELLQIVAEEKGVETIEYEQKAAEYRKYIERCLLYYPKFCYMQKTCYEIARFLKTLGDEEQYDILYRAFSGIQLWKKQEGWRAFSHYMNSQSYLCLKAKDRGRILMHLFLIYGDVMRIKEECRYSPNALDRDSIMPRHYTTIEVLKILLENQEQEKPKLRLWNSVYMNDPYEGVCFLDLLGHSGKNKEQLSKYFDYMQNNGGNLSPTNGNVYITSLTKEKDSLLMWMTYADMAEGCSIAFSDDFFDIRSRFDGPMGLPVYADDDYPLYQVQYIDEREAKKGNIKIVNTDTVLGKRNRRRALNKKEENIRKSMEAVCKNIQDLEEYMELLFQAGDPRIDAVHGFIADALNEVRFLFKYAEYEQEQEMRVVSYSYQPKFEEKFDVPRMYAEVDRPIQIKEVTLGPKIRQDKADEIVAWLYATGKVEMVTKSKIHIK